MSPALVTRALTKHYGIGRDGERPALAPLPNGNGKPGS